MKEGVGSAERAISRDTHSIRCYADEVFLRGERYRTVLRRRSDEGKYKGPQCAKNRARPIRGDPVIRGEIPTDWELVAATQS